MRRNVLLKKAVIESNDFLLTLHGPKGRERLGIRSPYPRTQLALELFQGLGVMHLVAPYLPRVIDTDATINRHLRKLIGDMYRSEGRNPPTIYALGGKRLDRQHPRPPHQRAIVAGSAGKDTLWNIWRAQEEFGSKNVLVAHIAGLNQPVAKQERAYTLQQAKKLGFRNPPNIIDLLNSSKNSGYAVMRSRDLFLAGLLTPIAIEFGASSILTEGFAEETPDEPFSGKEATMKTFNTMLQRMGAPVQVAWKNRPEMDIIRDLYTHRPQWMDEVCNCFTVPKYFRNCRRAWEKHAPYFPLYPSQCGSCVKCRIVTLGRILYDKRFLKYEGDVRYFLKNTAGWIGKNRERLADMISGSFMRDFARARYKYHC